MSNYYCKVKVKATGEIIDVIACDDFFGKHQYGYKLDNGREKAPVYTESEVEHYHPIKNLN